MPCHCANDHHKTGEVMSRSTTLVADNIDTLIMKVRLGQDFPLELARQLEVL
jgi:hypothetical protein